MKRRDIASGCALAVLGLLVAQQSRSLTYNDEFGPGPGLLPLWLGLILAAFGACLAISTALRKSTTESHPEPESGDSEVPMLTKFLRVFPAWLALVAMVAVVNVLG